jgi:aspartyl-tRNA(Asn)/glutamyl-tRNA(Gln) amidotransferase subunit A
MLDASVAAYYVVALAEASSNLARFDGVRYGRAATLASGEGLIDLYERSRGEGFGAEVKRRIMLGTHLLSAGYQDAFYVRALRARRRLAQDYARAFERCDVIATPTTPSPAFRIGERVSDPLSMYLEDVYTVGVNLAGLPAASIPMGEARVDGAVLPVGVQLVAPAFEESRLL